MAPWYIVKARKGAENTVDVVHTLVDSAKLLTRGENSRHLNSHLVIPERWVSHNG